MRYALALPVFYFLIFANKLAWPKLDVRDFPLLILQALAGGVGYSALLIFGLTIALVHGSLK